MFALKAQNQCRQTLAALAEIKNPRRTTLIGQQNNATNQQVNNAAIGANPAVGIVGALNRFLNAAGGKVRSSRNIYRHG